MRRGARTPIHAGPALLVLAVAAGLAMPAMAQRGGGRGGGGGMRGGGGGMRGGGGAGRFGGAGGAGGAGRFGGAGGFNPAATGSMRYGGAYGGAGYRGGVYGGAGYRGVGYRGIGGIGGPGANWGRFDGAYAGRFPAGYRTYWSGGYAYYGYPALPFGAAPVPYGDYTAYVANGAYYLPQFYNGEVVYVAVPPP
jgi:hypothetical protein